MTNNVAGTYTPHQILFGSSNTDVRTIGGNAIRLLDNGGADPKIENQSSAGHVINLNIEGDGDAGDPLELNPVNGDLTFGGTINNQGSDVLVYGDNAKSLNLNGVLSGSGKLILKEYSHVKLGATNTYTGNTEIDEGELWINEGGAIPTGSDIYLGNGTQASNPCKIFLADTDGGQTLSHDVNINPGNSGTRYLGSLNSSGTNTFSGDIIRDSISPIPALTIEVVNSGGTLILSGVIDNSSAVTKIGSGTATLTAQNTYTGLTTVSAGTLILNRTGGTTIPNTNDVTINGGTLRISTDQTIDDLVLSSGKLIVDNGVTLTITGSYTGGGTIENNGSIVNQSSSAFPGNSTTISAMKNLEVNNASGLTLNRSLTINGDLKLTQGALILDTCNLILGPSATISGTPSSSNMIVTNGTGTVRKEWGATGSFTFPIGDNTGTAEYSPITLDFTQGTFGTGAYAEVNVTNAKHGSNSSTTDFINRYWTVNQSGISSFSCDVDLVYVDADLNGTEANIYCGKYDGSSWSQGNQADANTNTLSFTGASSFSTFTGGEAAVLPISLLDFKAERINADHAVVHWSTASEVNNSHFELMRSRDGSNFEHLCQIDGAGNSHELINYRWLDEQAGSQAIYYQIKQTDFNGETEIFGPIRLAALADVSNELKFYPNPVSDVCHLELIEAEPDLLAVQLMDVQGRILYQKDWQLGRGHHLLEIPMAELQGGTYVLRIGNGFSWTYKRLMKN